MTQRRVRVDAGRLPPRRAGHLRLLAVKRCEGRVSLGLAHGSSLGWKWLGSELTSGESTSSTSSSSIVRCSGWVVAREGGESADDWGTRIGLLSARAARVDGLPTHCDYAGPVLSLSGEAESCKVGVVRRGETRQQIRPCSENCNYESLPSTWHLSPGSPLDRTRSTGNHHSDSFIDSFISSGCDP